MKLLIGLLMIVLICLILAFDLILIPLAVKVVIGWFGIALSFWQCLFMVILFNVVTYGFRKKG